jgi:hypothetical protein
MAPPGLPLTTTDTFGRGSPWSLVTFPLTIVAWANSRQGQYIISSNKITVDTWLKPQRFVFIFFVLIVEQA